MANKKTKKIQERIIYLLLAPNTKKFYIGDCAKESVRETYRHHLKGRRESTREFIADISSNRPCLFALETLNGTKDDATNCIIAWTKIFLENGYESCNHQTLIEMTEHLYFETDKLFRERKSKPIEEITSCKNCAMPKFNHKICEKYPDEITEEEFTTKKNGGLTYIYLTENDYEIISNHAKEQNMDVPAYIRMAAKYPSIVQCDYRAISAHTKEIGEIRNAINRLIFTIDASNNYLPREIETIVDLMKEVFATENQLIKELRKERDELRNKRAKPFEPLEQ